MRKANYFPTNKILRNHKTARTKGYFPIILIITTPPTTQVQNRQPKKEKHGQRESSGHHSTAGRVHSELLVIHEPRDEGRLSVVSPTFRLEAEFDTVWESFLPEDYQSIIARSSDPSLWDRCRSKKHLYHSLCKNPILVDDGKKSFSLEKGTGKKWKKSHMLSARDLVIIWGDTPAYWIWTSAPASRFPEVAELLNVCWLDIRGKIDTSLLFPSTLYAAYLVFELKSGSYGFEEQPIDAAMGLVGREGSERTVYLDMQSRNRDQHSAPSDEADGNYPKKREDGWMEIKLGEFFMKEGEDGELEMRVSEVHAGHWKRGLVVEGIEVRPKAN